MRVAWVRQVRRVSRGNFLLDLQKHGIQRAVSFEHNHVIPQAHATGAHHFEADVDEAEKLDLERLVAHGQVHEPVIPPGRAKGNGTVADAGEDLLADPLSQ